MPCFLGVNTAKALIATADLLGCSIDYLLGRTDVKGVAAAPTAEPEKCVKVDTWHTGNPPEPGWYICRIEVDGVDKPQYYKHWYGGKTWQGLVNDIETVTHWMPVLEGDE